MRKSKRNTLPRRSSPKGIAARLELRIKSWESANKNPGKGQKFHKPGSVNPRKVGR